MIKNVYIRTRPGTDTGISDLPLIDISDTIRDFGLRVIRDKDEIDSNALILALGGDGTMLSAMHLAAQTKALVTGFNYGNLGYLVPDAAGSGRELVAKLGDLIADVMDPDRAKAYKITNYKLPTLSWDKNIAINDFYFVPAANGSAADFSVTVGKYGSNFTTKSSGMVIATPFGSTGLALSAGGSILAPNSGVLEIVPMLPHTLSSRPIIVPETDNITVSWDRRVEIFTDGRRVADFEEGGVIVKCRKRKISIVQPKNWDFFENLKNKMNWHA
jgi:NAD+ kinase